MEQIALTNDPNQEFSRELDGVVYRITLISDENFCFAEVYVNDVLVTPSLLVPANQALIPYEYINKGNLLFINTDDSDDYPNYTRFNKTQFLYVMSQKEIDAL